ncbi:MAG: hypothetical protein ACW987_12645 [Candidatus Thorarchaeota archaeon]
MLQILTHPAVSGLLVMTIVGALAYKLNFVDISGLISAFVVGFTIWYTGGIVSFVIILFQAESCPRGQRETLMVERLWKWHYPHDVLGRYVLV